MIPSAPDDMVSALGALGRKLYVVPSLGLVVTRLGDDPGRDFDRGLWRLLMEAAPLGTARRFTNGEWRHYGGDAGNSHRSPLGQINRQTAPAFGLRM